MQYTIVEKHISEIVPGDTIVCNGELYTVTAKNIKSDSFMGLTVFGNSYKSGHQPVQVATNLRG